MAKNNFKKYDRIILSTLWKFIMKTNYNANLYYSRV